MKIRTIALAAALILAPATAHATYTTPEQVGHGSGSFQVCTTPTQPGPWTYVIAADDPRIIIAPSDSWTFGRMDGSWIRRAVTNGQVTIVTAVPLSGAVGDSIKVRAPGTDDTTDLRLKAISAPSCITPSPTETPTWTASPSPSPSTTSTPSSSASATSPTPSTSPTATPSRPTGSPGLPTTSAPSTSGTSVLASGTCGDSELACTGVNSAPLIGTGLLAILAGWLVWPRRTRRH